MGALNIKIILMSNSNTFNLEMKFFLGKSFDSRFICYLLFHSLCVCCLQGTAYSNNKQLLLQVV